MLKNYMIKCIESREVVSIFCDADNPGTHLTGIIDSINDDELLIRHISPNGYYDGFVLVHVSDIFRIDYGGAYEGKIQKLYLLRKQVHPKLVQTETLYDSLLRFCKEQNKIVSFELPNCALRGNLINYSYEYIHMLLVDENGRYDGETVVSSDEIISIAVDTTVEQNILILLSSE